MTRTDLIAALDEKLIKPDDELKLVVLNPDGLVIALDVDSGIAKTLIKLLKRFA
jgi:hypothetical protein